MKFEFDRKLFKICLYAFLTVAALILFYRMLEASEDIWVSFVNGFRFVMELLSPFILSIFIAYLLSPAVQVIDLLLGQLLRKERFAKARKLISLIVVYAALIAVIVISLYYVIPGIVQSMKDLTSNLTTYWGQLNNFYTNNILSSPLFASDTAQKALSIDTLKVTLENSLTGAVSQITSIVLKVLSSIVVGILGLVMSFYLLNEREHIVASFERLLHAKLGDKRSAAVMNFLKDVDKVFGRYISAKLLLALIMFVMCTAAFSIIGLRYSLLMSAIVAVTTLIPYLGPYLGAIPPIVIAFLESPAKGITISIAVLVIHQIDNYVFEPYVFSDKMGLSPFWILLSIMLGGGLFGLWGVLLAVPVAGVIKLIITRYIRVRAIHRQRQRDGGGSAETSE